MPSIYKYVAHVHPFQASSARLVGILGLIALNLESEHLDILVGLLLYAINDWLVYVLYYFGHKYTHRAKK